MEESSAAWAKRSHLGDTVLPDNTPSSQNHKAKELCGPGSRCANMPLHIESICLELQVLEKQPLTGSPLLCTELLPSKCLALGLTE